MSSTTNTLKARCLVLMISSNKSDSGDSRSDVSLSWCVQITQNLISFFYQNPRWVSSSLQTAVKLFTTIKKRAVAAVRFWTSVRTWTFENRTEVRFKVQEIAEPNQKLGSAGPIFVEPLLNIVKVRFWTSEPDWTWVQGSRKCLNWIKSPVQDLANLKKNQT